MALWRSGTIKVRGFRRLKIRGKSRKNKVTREAAFSRRPSLKICILDQLDRIRESTEDHSTCKNKLKVYNKDFLFKALFQRKYCVLVSSPKRSLKQKIFILHFRLLFARIMISSRLPTVQFGESCQGSSRSGKFKYNLQAFKRDFLNNETFNIISLSLSFVSF